MDRRRWRCSIVALLLTVLLPLVGCGANQPTARRVKIMGVDGNTGKSFGAQFRKEPGAIAAMRGTTPLTELPGDFLDRLNQRRPNLTEVAYAAESYDATVITALAAQIARSNRGTAIAPHVNGVTVGGTKCRQVQACLSLVASGANIDYDGIGGGLDFTAAGEPSVGNYGVLSYGHNGQVTNTTYVVTGDPKNAVADDTPEPPRNANGSGGPLRLGSLLPQTGALSAYGPGMLAGVELAVAEINNAGGVNGARVTLTSADDATDTAVATQAAKRLLEQNVGAIIGPAASDIGKAILEPVTSAGVVLFSPGNTLDEFTTLDDHGLYFRTAPPDSLQAKLVANVMAQDGGDVIAILHQNSAYGTSLASGIQRNLLTAGLKPADVLLVGYDPTQRQFGQYMKKLKSFKPDFIVVVGYSESVQIVRELNAAGIGPKR